MTTKENDPTSEPSVEMPNDNVQHADGDTSADGVTCENPSVKTRFPKGQSGNPSGRPKGSRNKRTIVEEVLNEKITIHDARSRKVSKFEVMVRQVSNDAMKGSAKALDSVLVLIKTFGLADKLPEPRIGMPVTADDQALIADYMARHGATLQAHEDSENEGSTDTDPVPPVKPEPKK